MSWFSSSTPQIDAQVEKATSESIPFGEIDLPLALEISDTIRSKSVPPKDAMRALRKRIINKNPNVQLATIHLTDTCIKNGGAHFLTEIASREFVDVLGTLARNSSLNADVKRELLQYIQEWSVAFAGQPQLSQMGSLCDRLKAEGYEFPETSQKVISATFIDSSAPPEWIDSDICMKCNSAFGLLNRKHHCRSCGGVFCQDCSSHTCKLPALGINDPVRVCDDCYDRHATRGSRKPRHSAASVPPDPLDDDEDFRKAISLSLQESQNAAPAPQAPAAPAAPAAADLEEDAELAAAIRASLQDLEEQKARSGATETNSAPLYRTEKLTAASSGSFGIPSVSSVPAPAGTTNPVVSAASAELSATDEETLHLFANLLESLKSQPPGTILHDPKAQEMHEKIVAMRPKITRALADAVSRYDTYVELHGKLGTALRYYDTLLEERLARAYGKIGVAQQGGPAAYSAQPGGYPSGPNGLNGPNGPGGFGSPGGPGGPGGVPGPYASPGVAPTATGSSDGVPMYAARPEGYPNGVSSPAGPAGPAGGFRANAGYAQQPSEPPGGVAAGYPSQPSQLSHPSMPSEPPSIPAGHPSQQSQPNMPSMPSEPPAVPAGHPSEPEEPKPCTDKEEVLLLDL